MREMVSVSCWLKLVWPWRSPCSPAAISAGCQILRPLPGCWACPFPAPRLVRPCADSFQTSNHKNNSIPSLHVDHTNDSVQGQKSRAGAERNAGTCGWGHGTTLQLLVHRLKFTDLFNLREVRMKKQRLKCNRLEQVFRCCPNCFTEHLSGRSLWLPSLRCWGSESDNYRNKVFRGSRPSLCFAGSCSTREVGRNRHRIGLLLFWEAFLPQPGASVIYFPILLLIQLS